MKQNINNVLIESHQMIQTSMESLKQRIKDYRAEKAREVRFVFCDICGNSLKILYFRI